MTTREQIDAFESDLRALVDRYRKEFDLPYAAAIGVLQLQAAVLQHEVIKGREDEDE